MMINDSQFNTHVYNAGPAANPQFIGELDATVTPLPGEVDPQWSSVEELDTFTSTVTPMTGEPDPQWSSVSEM